MASKKHSKKLSKKQLKNCIPKSDIKLVRSLRKKSKQFSKKVISTLVKGIKKNVRKAKSPVAKAAVITTIGNTTLKALSKSYKKLSQKARPLVKKLKSMQHC